MEERLAESQNQPDKMAGEGSIDSASVSSFLDWPCADLDDVLHVGGVGNISLQGDIEPQRDVNGHEQFVASMATEHSNDSTMHSEAQSSVPTTVTCNMSSTAAMAFPPDLLHSDRCVDPDVHTIARPRSSRLYFSES